MKKSLFILFSAIFTFISTSCKKETVVAPGAQTFFKTASGWTTNDGGITYTANINLTAIDNYYDANGAVLVYNDLGSGEYEALPSVYGGITYRFTYTLGKVYIDAQNSNGNTITPVPPNLNLKIVLLD